MKIIIDMPDEDYEFTKGAKTARYFSSAYYVELILKGIPLDDVTEEIKTEYDRIPWRNSPYDDGRLDSLKWVLTILGNKGRKKVRKNEND